MRIKISDLEAVLRRINEATNNPTEPWTPQEGSPNLRASVGTYVLDFAYGGVRLCQITSDGGAQRDVTGRGTKREVYNLMHAFLSGLAAKA